MASGLAAYTRQGPSGLAAQSASGSSFRTPAPGAALPPGFAQAGYSPCALSLLPPPPIGVRATGVALPCLGLPPGTGPVPIPVSADRLRKPEERPPGPLPIPTDCLQKPGRQLPLPPGAVKPTAAAASVLGCPHNGRDGISVSDVLEHFFNGERGSAFRDISESGVVQDVFKAVGDEVLRPPEGCYPESGNSPLAKN